MSLDFTPIFPSEFVSPKEKEEDKYGLAYASAMYYSSERHGARLLYNDDDYDALTEIAQGRQSVDNIKRLFGHFQLPSDAMDGGAADLSFIDLQVLNLAPKYINRAVGRLQAFKYDISASVLDVKSIDQEKHYKTQLRAYQEIKEWLGKIGINAQKIFGELDIAQIPEESDEMLYEMNTNPKVKKIIKIEKLLKLLHYSNNWDQTSRELDWDFVTYGKGFIHCYLDKNGMPKEDRINAKYAIYPYSESEIWDDVEYFGFIDFVTANEFIRETADQITPKDQQAVIEEYGRGNRYLNASDSTVDEYRQDGLAYIPVMKYYFLSEDNRVFDSKVSKNTGNRILVERAFDYVPSEELEALYKPKGGNRIIKNTYTSLYGGCWVIDSNIVYNHKKMDWPRTSLVDMSPPIKAISPNYKEGRTVSVVAQMIEPLYMINVAWNKMKDILAKGWMGIREINFDEIEKVAMGAGGKKWSARQVYEHLLKTNTLIKRGKTNIYDQSNGQAIIEGKAGLDMADYMTTLTTSLRILDEITGTASFEGSAPPERLAVGVAQANLASTHESMEYLYSAHEKMYLEVSKTMLSLAQMSHKMGNKIAGDAMGTFFEMDDDVAYAEIGIMLQRQPTDQEWVEFYADLRELLKAGLIRASDSAFVREVDNLKEARRILAIREEKYARIKKKELQQAKVDQIEITNAASEGKAKTEAAKIKLKAAADKELKIIEGEIELRKLDKQFAYDSALKGQEKEGDLVIKKQEGKDRIMTQGLKNITEKMKVEKREDKSPED